MLSNLELRSSFSANCIPLENFCILTCSSSIKSINRLDFRFEINKEDLDKYYSFNKSLDYPQFISLFTDNVQQIVGYLAG